MQGIYVIKNIINIYQHVDRSKFKMSSNGIHINNMKLSDSEVEQILERISLGESLASIEKDYDVGYTTLKKIKRNIAYTHIDRSKYNIKQRKRG